MQYVVLCVTPADPAGRAATRSVPPKYDPCTLTNRLSRPFSTSFVKLNLVLSPSCNISARHTMTPRVLYRGTASSRSLSLLLVNTTFGRARTMGERRGLTLVGPCRALLSPATEIEGTRSSYKAMGSNDWGLTASRNEADLVPHRLCT